MESFRTTDPDSYGADEGKYISFSVRIVGCWLLFTCFGLFVAFIQTDSVLFLCCFCVWVAARSAFCTSVFLVESL